MAEHIYDIIIIGGGPAGLTAGLYASRGRADVVLLEKNMPGGQVLVAELIENFPGFPEGIKGIELAERMRKQAEDSGLKIVEAEVGKIAKSEKGHFSITTEEGKIYKSLTLIIATGARWKKLKVPGEEKLTGRGVSYCATCDGPLFKKKNIVVVGGGDKAVEDALFLAKFANKVMLVHRRDRLRAMKVLQERAIANKKIEFVWNSVVSEILGRNKVSAVKVKDLKTGSEKTIDCDGIFIFVGIQPNTEYLKGFLEIDEKGFLIADDSMKTSQDGIFACGDLRKKSLLQVVTATGEGAQAAFSALQWVERLKGVAYE